MHRRDGGPNPRQPRSGGPGPARALPPPRDAPRRRGRAPGPAPSQRWLHERKIKVNVGTGLPPRRPPSLPALGRGSLRLPARLTGLAPAFQTLSGQSCRRPTGPAAAAASRSLLRFLPGSSGFPSPPRVARRKPARRWASSPLPRRDQWAPAAGKPRLPPGGGGPSGRPAGRREGPESGGRGRAAGPRPALRCLDLPRGCSSRGGWRRLAPQSGGGKVSRPPSPHSHTHNTDLKARNLR